jgi:hypothetical protein
VYNAVAIESLGTPAVALTNEGFITDAGSAASGKGMPGIRVVPETIPCECSVQEQIEVGVSAVMDNIVAALTKPLTAEDKSPKPTKAEKPSRIIFKGNLAEVNHFFYQRGWTDGLPVIPPTEEAVAEMLTGTDLPADHVVTKIIPRLGKATVEKIAINAVMAGALPTYMPALIAGVQVLMDPRTRSDMLGVSTGSFIAFWVVNGSIRNALHINGGPGALSPGNMANDAIGRAMALTIKNIGGIRKGVEDMGVLGNPSKYSLVLGEYEEESPWEPLHIERGFKKEDSTLTFFYVMNLNQAMAAGTDAKGILDAMVRGAGIGMSCILLIPGHAKILSGEGWTKKKVKEFILENASAPPFPGAPPSGGQRPPQQQAPPPRMKPDPDSLMIVVAGGPGAFMGILRCVGGGAFGNSFVTKKIELPANWNRLVARYKNIVPTYARY